MNGKEIPDNDATQCRLRNAIDVVGDLLHSDYGSIHAQTMTLPRAYDDRLADKAMTLPRAHIK